MPDQFKIKSVIDGDITDEATLTGGGHCSICRRSTVHEFRPFCSRRCADVDLSRWLTGAYAIASGGADADEDGEGVSHLPDAAALDKPRI